VFHLLKQSRHPHFNKFVKVAGSDGEEFDSFEKRIRFIQGFFQHSAVEGEPGFVAIEMETRVVQASTRHGQTLLRHALMVARDC
jgi:hypothetical protein